MLIPRLISSIIIIVLFILSIFLNKRIGEFIFILSATVISFFLWKELSSIIAKIVQTKLSDRFALFISIFFLPVIFLYEKIESLPKDKSFLLAILIAIIFLWLKILFDFEKKEKIASDILSFAILSMIIIPASCIYKIYSFSSRGLDGRLLFLFFIAVTKSADIGGYFGGILSNKIMKGGNHKIVPKISPKKSWEGTLSGLLLSVLSSFLLWKIAFGEQVQNILLPIIVGIVLFVGSFLGDISESVLKRAAEIKDSGNTIPGIGGVLDLMDSFIFNAPLFYFFLFLFFA